MIAPDSAAPGFESRLTCPVCRSTGGTLLYDQPFTTPPIRGYLEAFYAPQGGVEFPHLEGARFTLIECGECGLIYQREVGNDALLMLLYDRWIDPAKVLARYDGVHGEEYFLRLARHVANVVRQLGRRPTELRFSISAWAGATGVASPRASAAACRGRSFRLRALLAQKRLACTCCRRRRSPATSSISSTRSRSLNISSRPRDVLAGLVRSLAPGGLLRLSVPDGWGLKKRLAQPDWTAAKRYAAFA